MNQTSTLLTCASTLLGVIIGWLLSFLEKRIRHCSKKKHVKSHMLTISEEIVACRTNVCGYYNQFVKDIRDHQYGIQELLHFVTSELQEACEIDRAMAAEIFGGYQESGQFFHEVHFELDIVSELNKLNDTKIPQLNKWADEFCRLSMDLERLCFRMDNPRIKSLCDQYNIMLKSRTNSNESVLKKFVKPMNKELKSCCPSAAIEEALKVAEHALFCAEKLAHENDIIANEVAQNSKNLSDSILKLKTIVDKLKQQKCITRFNCSTMKHSLSKLSCLFWTVFFVICFIIIGLLLLYFLHFHGPLSDLSSDWANMSTFITGFGTMLFTGLNVWVVWSLTREMNAFTASSKKRELQANAINCFNRYMYNVFQPIEDFGACEVKTEHLLQAEDAFKRLKVYSGILKTLDSSDYKEFLSKYHELGEKAFHNTREDWGNSSLEQEAFPVFEKARYISDLLTNEMMSQN